MKKTKLVGLLTSLSLVLGAGVAAFGIGSAKAKEVKADNPSYGTITTNFKQVYDNSGATPNADYVKALGNPQDFPLYIAGTETLLFTATGNKGGANANVSMRDYHNNHDTYYLYLKYSSAKTADALGNEIVFAATGDYLFKNISSSYLYTGGVDLAIYYSSDNSTWTQAPSTATNGQPFECDLPTYSPFVKLVHKYYDTTNKVIQIRDLSLDFYDPTKVTFVSFDTQGGSDVAQQYVNINGLVERPSDPTKPNVGSSSFAFVGWFTDPVDSSTEFDFDHDVVTGPLTLYAHWEEHILDVYTLTFDTQGGSSIEPCVVPTDGTLWTKPANPTYPSDSRYNYSFHDWYTSTEFNKKFDFTKAPTGDATAYAGWSKKAHVPSGYTTINPVRKVDKWGTELTSNYQALEIDTHNTIDPEKTMPQMHWSITQNGNTNSGMKLTSTDDKANYLLNNAKMEVTITDPTKYFTGFRFELYVTTWDSTLNKTATLKTGGVQSDSGVVPHDSLSNSDLVLIGDCSNKPQEFTVNLSYIGSAGVRVRYIYVTFGTYTDAEQVVKYAEQFNDANVCGTNPGDGLDETKWAYQESQYQALSAQAQSDLTNYDGSNAEVLECLERYDRVVTLHGADYDFMGRIAAGKISNIVNNLIVSISNNSSIILVTAISLVAISAIIGFVFYRKRKEN